MLCHVLCTPMKRACPKNRYSLSAHVELPSCYGASLASRTSTLTLKLNSCLPRAFWRGHLATSAKASEAVKSDRRHLRSNRNIGGASQPPRAQTPLVEPVRCCL